MRLGASDERPGENDSTFFLKAVYDLPTTKGLIENLKINPSCRRLCGWECRMEVPSETPFCCTFNMFANEKVPDAIHAGIVQKNYTQKLIGHADVNFTAITGRKKACRKNTPKIKLKKKGGRKSDTENAVMTEAEIAEVKTRELGLQFRRTFAENVDDLPQECNLGDKRDRKEKTSYWCSYKLHLSIGYVGVPLAVILGSAFLHGSQVANPLTQITSKRVSILYDLADSAYDAEEIKDFSKKPGHVPVIDPNQRRSEKVELAPPRKICYREPLTVNRENPDLKDNYDARHVRIKRH